MLLLDVLIRYSAVTLLLAIAFLSFRDARHLIQGKLGCLTALSMSALMLGTAPQELALPSPVFEIVRLSDISNLALLWLFSLSLFRDDFKMGRAEWIAAGLYTLCVGTIRLWDIGWIARPPMAFHWFVTCLSAAMATHLIWTALAGRRDDLIESRRKGRLWFALGMAIAAAISILAEAFIYHRSPEAVNLIRAAVTFPIAVWAVVWLTQLRTERLTFENIQSIEPAAPQINPKDRAAHEQLIGLMEDEKYYREQGLTIRILSDKMRVPEHQLRVLINQGMGYRNFTAFLNSYRLREAKEMLADPAKARLPVLTIAMDVGFNSLAPFNRAFKSQEGVTPTAYRSQALK